jgi:hypothetical protein
MHAVIVGPHGDLGIAMGRVPPPHVLAAIIVPAILSILGPTPDRAILFKGAFRTSSCDRAVDLLRRE